MVDGGEEGVVVGVDAAGVDLGGRLDPRATAVVVDAQPPGDDRHPRVEAAVAGEGRHGPQRPDEGLLGQLLGGVAVAHPALAVRHQAVVVAAVQLVERLVLAALVPHDEQAVAIEVDAARRCDVLGPDGHPSATPSPPQREDQIVTDIGPESLGTTAR